MNCFPVGAALENNFSHPCFCEFSNALHCFSLRCLPVRDVVPPPFGVSHIQKLFRAVSSSSESTSDAISKSVHSRGSTSCGEMRNPTCKPDRCSDQDETSSSEFLTS